MMKGFFKSGKWMGLIVVGLLFAGCYGGGDSSSEGAVDTGSQAAAVSVPITVDPMNKTLTIGDGGLGKGSGTTHDGHAITLVNGATSLPTCTGAGADVQCWIRIQNNDPSMYLSNGILWAHSCFNCVTAQVDNADMQAGVPLGDCVGTGGDTGCGGSIEIDSAGYCIVEDGQYVTKSQPYNVTGCRTRETATSGIKPPQMLHPECGTIAYLWDFGLQDAKYNFWGAIVGDWFPQDPTGDGRYDWTDRSTYYIMATDLNNNSGTGPDQWGGTANGQAWINVGSHIRSNVLSGWNASGSNSLAEGRYFAVSVAVEYPDRIESQAMGNNMVNLDYEYYVAYGYIMRYNQNVVQEIASANLTAIGVGTQVVRGARFHCTANQASSPNLACDGNWAAYEGLGELTFGTASDYRGVGWVALSRGLASNFEYNAAIQKWGGGSVIMKGGVPATSGGWLGGPMAYLINPKAAGHHGVAHFDWALASATFYNSAAIIQEGPDSAPEMPLSLYYFQVLYGTSGLGSEFWMDMMATGTAFNIYHTNGTVYPSGNQMGTDDWTSYCSPPQGGFPMGCDGGLPMTFYDVHAGLELSNLNIGHSGPSAKGGDDFGGGVQQWSAHICVQ
jgi:hypothetical protein